MKKRVDLKLSLIMLTICLTVGLSACQADAHDSNQANDSSSCSVDLQIDIDTPEQNSIDFPIIRVKPHSIKAREGKGFAELLLGDAEFYETSLSPKMSNAALKGKIHKLEQLNNDEVIIDLYGKSQLQAVKSLLQETIDGYKNAIQFEDGDNTRVLCKWEFHPQSYYFPLDATAEDDDGNDVIMAYVEKGEVSHKVWITTRDESDFRIQNIYIYPNSEYSSPLDIETLHMIRALCGYQKPSDSEVEHVIEKADDIVKSVEIGEWAIVDAKVEEYRYWQNSEKPVYVINITAVPSFSGVNVLHVKQLETLKSKSDNASNYYYSELLLTFSSSGELIEAMLTSPIDTVSLVKSTDVEILDLQQSIDILTAYKEAWGVKILHADGLNAEEGYSIKAIIEDAEWGLARIEDIDGSSDFYLVPAIQFSGDYSIMFDDEIIYSYRDMFGEAYQFAPINLVDGSVIDTVL